MLTLDEPRVAQIILFVNRGHKVNNEKLTFTVTETASLLGLSRNSAFKGVMTGEIPHIRVGKRILIPRRALEAMLESAGKPKGS
jgi:excisionase family DNA binding protein